ncbi:MAG: phosphoenolpyruvate carboxykinase [Desulfurococcales archaeon]|nr:phosphoenolpyruvate carboxykinase [Desulfurococcales archaeon]
MKRASLWALAGDIESQADVEWDPSPARLREESLRYARRTRTGAIAVVSRKARARMPSRTRVIGDGSDEAYDIALEAYDWLLKREYYAVERCIGAGSHRFRILGLIEKSYPHLALMAHMNFFPCEREGGTPDIVTIDAPGWRDTWILIERRTGTTLILGSDYYGELKMSFLRLAMNMSRDLHYSPGLHAGSKLYRVRGRDGILREVGVLVFGLSGTGKTTLTLESHGLRPPEKAALRQDDIVILTPDGRAHGTEFNLYPKTDSVPELPPLYPAVTHQDAVLENVVVREDGTPDFSDLSITPNARALAIREAIPLADGRIDLDRVNALFFLTRRPEMPPLARLTSPEQAAAYFMLGESFRTSAEAGKPEPVRVPGFDPFMLEPKWRSGYLIMDLVDRLDLEVYVMNTGYVKDRKVTPDVSKRLMLEAVRGNVEWKLDKELGVEVAVRAGDMPLDNLLPENVYGPRYPEVVEALRRERVRFFEEKLPKIRFLADYV